MIRITVLLLWLFCFINCETSTHFSNLKISRAFNLSSSSSFAIHPSLEITSRHTLEIASFCSTYSLCVILTMPNEIQCKNICSEVTFHRINNLQTSVNEQGNINSILELLPIIIGNKNEEIVLQIQKYGEPVINTASINLVTFPMLSKGLAIDFKPNEQSGGLGDRIVGIIAVKIMARLLNTDFAISWTIDDLRPYFNYTNYSFEGKKANLSSITSLNLNDQQKDLSEVLSSAVYLSHSDWYKLNVNQELSQYLFVNPNYMPIDDGDYYSSIFYEYSHFYSNVLKPTSQMIEKINQILIFNKDIPFLPLIGIQIRTGDKFMNIKLWYDERFSILIPELDQLKVLENIKNHIELSYSPFAYRIFLTSDSETIYHMAVTIWQSEYVVYNNEEVKHLSFNEGELSKIFIDHLILSQNATRLYITYLSNYGRTAALCSQSNEIYSSTSLELLDKKDLVCKGEKIFRERREVFR